MILLLFEILNSVVISILTHIAINPKESILKSPYTPDKDVITHSGIEYLAKVYINLNL